MTSIIQRAPMMLGVMWMFQVIAFLLVGLRLYTRLVVMSNYGWDDHFFNAAVFLLLTYTILMTVATRFGLGQTMTNPTSIETSHALLLVNIGQSITSAAIVLVKISIAVFLLRIVSANRGQQIAVMVPVTLMSIIVIVATVVLWFACTPVSYSWDVTVPGGHCNPVTEFIAALVSGISIVVVEVFYASFPWYLIKSLQMPKREKILIGTSMSFGYISAICSIYRLLTLLKLAYASDSNFLLTIVDLLIWHAADITTQLVCIGVTVCRPLYKDWLNRIVDQIESISTNLPSSKRDTSYGAREAPSLIALQTIGGSAMPPRSDGGATCGQHGDVRAYPGSLGPTTKGRAIRSDAASEEYILNRAPTAVSEGSSTVGQN